MPPAVFSMQQKKDDAFFAEMLRFGFLCSCENCVHFDAPRGSCSFFWPNGEHRALQQKDQTHAAVSFCKDFELF